MLHFFMAFICGFVIPFISRRLGKILPNTTGAILSQLFHSPHFPKTHNPLRHDFFRKKWLLLVVNALLFGLLNATLVCFVDMYFIKETIPYAYLFIWITLCAANVDVRFFILPDCLTIPLMLIGFLFAIKTHIISPEESIFGACFAYLITVLSVFLLSFKHRYVFGAGDTKMAIALGTWLGIQGLNYAIFSSFFIFVCYAFCSQKRYGAYGPALGIAGLFSFFVLYTK